MILFLERGLLEFRRCVQYQRERPTLCLFESSLPVTASSPSLFVCRSNPNLIALAHQVAHAHLRLERSLVKSLVFCCPPEVNAALMRKISVYC